MNRKRGGQVGSPIMLRRRSATCDRLLTVGYSLVFATLSFSAGVILCMWQTREDRAIGTLVKAGADIQRFSAPDGAEYYDVFLPSCDDFTSNDDLLAHVSEIENVGVLELAPLPLRGAGIKSLLQLKSLRTLSVYVADGSLSREEYTELKRGMRLRNPAATIVGVGKDRNPLREKAVGKGGTGRVSK